MDRNKRQTNEIKSGRERPVKLDGLSDKEVTDGGNKRKRTKRIEE
jgi:hypothetical protein